jgi:hydrogenase expression/formation protein HypE
MKENHILLDHGSGGVASQNLISDLFLKHLDSPILHTLEDAAVLDNQQGQLAFTTDSYVVDPIFFPGGDIGCLAVNGTINDLSMRGARPLALSLGLILEEGLPFSDLERVIISISTISKQAGVPIVTGDTKVVPKGKADKIFINTSGIGIIDKGVDITASGAKKGDKIILSGSIGDHGITIMTQRAGLSMQGKLKSDSMALHTLVGRLLDELPGAIHTLRDPTRGGVATSLNEIAAASKLSVELDEQSIPVHPEVHAACEMLGLEPLNLANEGKCLIIVDADSSQKALEIIRDCPEGKEAAIIGEIGNGKAGRVSMKTPIGGTRIVSTLHGEPLPRIC